MADSPLDIKRYKEHRGILAKKYRSVFGKYVFIIEESDSRAKVYVGKCIYEGTELGSELTVGEIDGKLVNIRPGVC